MVHDVAARKFNSGQRRKSGSLSLRKRWRNGPAQSKPKIVIQEY